MNSGSSEVGGVVAAGSSEDGVVIAAGSEVSISGMNYSLSNTQLNKM
jgi:hypothetical protein